MSTVKVIHTELEMTPIYKDQCLYEDVNQFLKNYNFYKAEGNNAMQYGQNFIFVKK